MPRAFLIKKKKKYGLPAVASVHWKKSLVVAQLRETDFLENKSRHSCDSGSEHSSPPPSRSPSPAPSAVSDTYVRSTTFPAEPVAALHPLASWPSPPPMPPSSTSPPSSSWSAHHLQQQQYHHLHTPKSSKAAAAAAAAFLAPYLAPYLHPYALPPQYPGYRQHMPPYAPYFPSYFPHPHAQEPPPHHQHQIPSAGRTHSPEPTVHYHPATSTIPTSVERCSSAGSGDRMSEDDGRPLTIHCSSPSPSPSPALSPAGSGLDLSIASPAASPSSSPKPSAPTTSSIQAVPVTIKRRSNNSAATEANGSAGPRYLCPDCNKSYSTYSGLSKHQQFHCATASQRSFSCKYCEKTYQSLGALKMHIRTHTLPCKCDLCGKCFSRPWLLQGHIRTHTGEKPFACQSCNRAFADRSNLRAHLQTHSDVKKYWCRACGKTFSRMSLLLKHDGGACTANSLTTDNVLIPSTVVTNVDMEGDLVLRPSPSISTSSSISSSDLRQIDQPILH